MKLAIHTPLFGCPTVESHALQCPKCPATVTGAEWFDAPIDDCFPGQEFRCETCGTTAYVNWGLVEPDHLSTWLNPEHCPHRLCHLKATS